MSLKKCKDCRVEKPIKDFYPTQGDCKDCFSGRVAKNRKRNIEYYIKYDKDRQKYNNRRMFLQRYNGMKQRVNGTSTRPYNVEGKELLSKDEFLEWCYDIKNFNKFKKLWNNWKKNDFKRGYSPSIDRIDNDKGYSLDNIQWITQSQNTKKQYIS